MVDLTITLPESLWSWVQSQATAGHYESPSDYMGDLILRDQQSAAERANLQKLITEGIESG